MKNAYYKRGFSHNLLSAFELQNRGVEVERNNTGLLLPSGLRIPLFYKDGLLFSRGKAVLHRTREGGKERAKRAVNLAATVPANVPADVPANVSANVPANLPANASYTEQANVPANVPANMLANGPANGPANRFQKVPYIPKDWEIKLAQVNSITLDRAQSSKPKSVMFWHRTFNHVALNTVRAVLHQYSIPFFDDEEDCEPCLAMRLGF